MSSSLMSNDYIQRLNAWGRLSSLIDLLNGLESSAPAMIDRFEAMGYEDSFTKAAEFASLLRIRANDAANEIMDLTPGFKVSVFFDSKSKEWTYEAHRFPLVGGGLNG